MAVELSVPMNADNPGTTIDCRDFKNIFITAQWAGCDAQDGNFTIEVSNTGDGNWEPYKNNRYDIASSSGAHHWDWEKKAIPFIRVNYLHGGNSAGLYAITAWIEA